MTFVEAAFVTRDYVRTSRFAVSQLIVAGWTSRDREALEKHIGELEAIGVARPASTPVYYRISSARLTTQDAIEVAGPASSGEVEFVLAKCEGNLWVGVGSDHTDRTVETYSVTVSKQMCDKPLAPQFWSFTEIASHWDQIVLRSFIHEDGSSILYQEGTVAALLNPTELINGFSPDGNLPEGAIMFCGTFAAKGGIRPAARFEFEMIDPRLDRTISHGYDIHTLPVLG